MDIKKELKKVDKLESEFWKAEFNISEIANIIQPFFEGEIQTCMSSDGAIITDSDGERGFVKDFLKSLSGEDGNVIL